MGLDDSLDAWDTERKRKSTPEQHPQGCADRCELRGLHRKMVGSSYGGDALPETREPMWVKMDALPRRGSARGGPIP